MTEIVLKVPDDLPLPGLIARLNDLIAEEHLKWMLFIKSVDELAVDAEDITAFEDIREQTWKETRKKFSEFVKKFGEPEAKEDIDQLLLKNKRRTRDA